MNKNKLHIEEEVRRTMDMTNYLQEVEGNPYLLTRVLQQIENQKENTYFFDLSPRLKAAFGILIIAINAFILLQTNNFSTQSTANSAAIDFADEYDLAYATTDQLDYIFDNK